MKPNKTQQIIKRIRTKGRGWVFTPKAFLDIATRNVVDQVLFRLIKKDYIRRVARGIYDFPKYSSTLGMLTPDPDHIAQALALQNGHVLQPSGALSANLFGLSTQVPSKPVYLTNGRSRRRKVGSFVLQFKHTPIRVIGKGASRQAIALVQALLFLGRDGIDDRVIGKCREQLSIRDKQHLLNIAPHSPGWMVNLLHQIAG